MQCCSVSQHCSWRHTNSTHFQNIPTQTPHSAHQLVETSSPEMDVLEKVDHVLLVCLHELGSTAFS